MTRNILGIDVKALLPGIAAHLAHLDDEDQAGFLQVFADELVKTCGTYHAAELQAAYIRTKLKGEALRVFEMIGYKDPA